MSFEERKTKIKKSVWTSFISSLLLVIFALILLLKEQDMISMFVLVLGYCGLFFGCIHLLIYFRMEREKKFFSNDLLEGALFLFFGAIAIFKNVILADMLTYLLGAYIIYQNADRLQVFLNFGQWNKQKSWYYIAILNIIGMFLGTFIILNPFDGIVVMSYSILVSEFLLVLQSFYLLMNVGKVNEAE